MLCIKEGQRNSGQGNAGADRDGGPPRRRMSALALRNQIDEREGSPVRNLVPDVGV